MSEDIGKLETNVETLRRHVEMALEVSRSAMQMSRHTRDEMTSTDEIVVLISSELRKLIAEFEAYRDSHP
jgi:hypothetical protein